MILRSVAWKTILFAAFVMGQSWAQNLQQKDLLFPQVAVGPTIESVITVTNRGGSPYHGRLHFWTGQNQDWNPVLNGDAVAGSGYEIVVPSAETRTYKVTGQNLSAGAIAIRCQDLSQDNFVEGNLTY